MPDRVFIAIPSGRAAPDIEHSSSLTDTMLALYEHGMKPERRIIHGNCYVHLCRDLLTNQFLKTDCSHLFFWDDDVAAPPGALSRLLAYNRDFIVAPYPKKVDPSVGPENSWPYVLADGIPDALGLLECELAATGFMLIKRHVIEAVCAMRADWKFWHEPSKSEITNIFPTGLLPDLPRDTAGRMKWWGEDYAFSVFARRAGFKIWLNPAETLIHAGRNIWRGDFTKNADAPEAVSAAA